MAALCWTMAASAGVDKNGYDAFLRVQKAALSGSSRTQVPQQVSSAATGEGNTTDSMSQSSNVTSWSSSALPSTAATNAATSAERFSATMEVLSRVVNGGETFDCGATAYDRGATYKPTTSSSTCSSAQSGEQQPSHQIYTDTGSTT